MKAVYIDAKGAMLTSLVNVLAFFCVLATKHSSSARHSGIILPYSPKGQLNSV